MPKIKYIVLLYVLYTVLNMLFPMELGTNRGQTSERIYPQVCMALLSMYCTFYTLKNFHYLFHNRYFSAFAMYFVFLWLYSFLPSEMDYSLVERIIHIMKLTIAMSMMFAIYLSLKEDLELEKYVYYIYAFCVVYGFFTLFRDTVYLRMIGRETTDSNSGFILASCIPMSFLIPNKRIRIYVFLLVMVGTLMSGQRAAFVGAIFSLPFVYRYLLQSLKAIDWIVLIAVFIVVVMPYVYRAIDNQIARHYEDMVYVDRYGGGRLIFWNCIWENFKSSGIIQIFFGHLNDSVPALLKAKVGSDIEAHNGWLQNLYTYGLVGLCFYIGCYISFLKNNSNIGDIMPEYKNFFFLLFAMFFVRSTVSHGNFDVSYIPFCMSFALLVARSEDIEN